MSRIKTTGASILLAMDATAAVLAEIARSGDGYPPFNIERIGSKKANDDTRLRITLAVAGFSEADLDVVIEEGHLIIRGRQSEKEEVDYLFRGIARRQFQKSFRLAPDMDVLDAVLRKGLLIIELVDPKSKQVVQKINISPSH